MPFFEPQFLSSYHQIDLHDTRIGMINTVFITPRIEMVNTIYITPRIEIRGYHASRAYGSSFATARFHRVVQNSTNFIN